MGLQSNLFHPNHAAPLTSTPSSSALRPSHRTVSLQMDAPNRSLLSQVQAAAHMQAGSSRRPALKQLTAPPAGRPPEADHKVALVLHLRRVGQPHAKPAAIQGQKQSGVC